MMRGEKSVEGTGAVRRCIRNLMVHSSLPAAWETYSLDEIGDSVAAALVATLDAVAVAVSLRTRPEEPPTEATSSRAADTGFPEVTAIARHAIRNELHCEAPGQTWKVPDPLGGASINLASVPVGIDGDEILVVASRQEDFPSEGATPPHGNQRGTSRARLAASAHPAGRMVVRLPGRKFGRLDRGSVMICRSIVEAHSGRLNYEPNPHGGSIFPRFLT